MLRPAHPDDFAEDLTVPTNKQRREAARRHLERQLERRQQRETRRRRFTLIASVAGSVVVVGLIVGFIVAVGNDDKSKPAAADTPTVASPTPTPTPTTSVTTVSKTSGACGYTSAPAGNSNLDNVGFPPDPAKTPTIDRVMTITTNRGAIKIDLDAKLAPCNVQSIAYLAGKKFYDNSSCHRLVTSGIFVLQCGDPTGTGAGGPSYTVKDENLTKASYTQGVVAMANAGPGTNGSQFFIITKDSSAGLQKNYTEIGKVTQGMDIVEAIAEGGSDNSNTTGDGKPKLPLTFKTVTVTPPVTGAGKPAKVQVTTTVTPAPSAS